MARGRKPTPPGLKVILGQKPPRSPPPTSGGPGDPPARFTAAQKAVWYEIVASVRPGHLQPSDRPTLAALVVQMDTQAKLEALVAREGLTQKDTGHKGLRRIAPWQKELRTVISSVQQLSTALRLTPMARTNLQLPTSPDTRSVFERMLDADCPGHRSGQPWPSDEEIAAGLAQPPNFIVPKS